MSLQELQGRFYLALLLTELGLPGSTYVECSSQSPHGLKHTLRIHTIWLFAMPCPQCFNTSSNIFSNPCYDQKFTGGPFGTTTKIPKSTFTLKSGKDKVTVHEMDNGSGTMLHREFCATCGSPLMEFGVSLLRFVALLQGNTRCLLP